MPQEKKHWLKGTANERIELDELSRRVVVTSWVVAITGEQTTETDAE